MIVNIIKINLLILFLIISVDTLKQKGILSEEDEEKIREEQAKEAERRSIKTFIVTTLLNEPYMTLRKEGTFLAGNDRFEGYLADIVAQISSLINLKYEIRIARDGMAGRLSSNGTWDGMLGEVISGEADMAAGPLTISEERKLAVSFTKPFMIFRSTAVIKKPRKKKKKIHNAKDLLESNYLYGVIENSITQKLFSWSGNATFQRMWARMGTFWPPALVQSVQEGILRARHEEYAFILDTPLAEYLTGKEPCDLYTVEPFLDRRYYAFALRKDDDRLNAINAAMESLYATSEMQRMYLKWWRGECHKKNNISITRPARNGKSKPKSFKSTDKKDILVKKNTQMFNVANIINSMSLCQIFTFLILLRNSCNINI